MRARTEGASQPRNYKLLTINSVGRPMWTRATIQVALLGLLIFTTGIVNPKSSACHSFTFRNIYT